MRQPVSVPARSTFVGSSNQNSNRSPKIGVSEVLGRCVSVNCDHSVVSGYGRVETHEMTTFIIIVLTLFIINANQ